MRDRARVILPRYRKIEFSDACVGDTDIKASVPFHDGINHASDRRFLRHVHLYSIGGVIAIGGDPFSRLFSASPIDISTINNRASMRQGRG